MGKVAEDKITQIRKRHLPRRRKKVKEALEEERREEEKELEYEGETLRGRERCKSKNGEM